MKNKWEEQIMMRNKWEKSKTRMKKAIGIVCTGMCLTFLFGTADVDAKSINTKTVINGGHTYQLFDESMTFDKAKAYCEDKGGHLVTITSAQEQKVVRNLIKKGKKNNYWLGAQKDADGKFTSWVTGEEMEYTNFASRQPDNYRGNEKALMIYRKNNPLSVGDTSFYWNDIQKNGDCNGEAFFGKKNFGFICEWDKEVYTITYNTNKGKLPNNTQFTYEAGQAVTLKKPTRSGYAFKGWYEDAKFTKKVTKIKKNSKKHYVLYAKWEKK